MRLAKEVPARSILLVGAISVALAGLALLATSRFTKSSPTAEAKSTAETQPSKAPQQGPTRIEMANVDLYLDPDLVLHVRHLEGDFLSTRDGQPPWFDDKLSFLVSIDSAEIAVGTDSMSHALNRYVFDGPDAPIKDLELSTEGDKVKQKGTMRKGIPIPFETIGTLAATEDGKIRIHTEKIKAAHLPVKGLMETFGVEMANVINTRKTKGISVEGDDLILDPSQMLPPPKMRGKVTSVRIEGNQIVQTFGKPSAAKASTKGQPNYIAYRGGIVRFGRMTMNDADMQLIDSEPKTPFLFFPDRYNDQLVAGYSKTIRSGGLRVFMPDYDPAPAK